jgi:hypothetical protein
LRILALLLALAAGPAYAAGPRLDIIGFADAGFVLDSNRPADGNITGFSAYPRDREPMVNMASVGLGFSWGGFLAKLNFAFGAGMDALHAGNPGLSVFWKSLLKFHAGYTIPVGHGLTIEGGLFTGPLGLEKFVPKDNLVATHGYLAENVPFYNAGIRIGYPITDNFTVKLYWINGFGNVDQDYAFRSAGLQLIWTSSKVAASFNGYFGPGLTGATNPDGTLVHDYKNYRYFGDLWVVYQPIAPLKLALVLDGGIDQAGGDLAGWYGTSLFVRYQIVHWLAAVARGEVYGDGSGRITGTAQLMKEATLTAEFSALDHLLVRVEGRLDFSDAAYFEGSKDRALLVLSFVGYF